MRILQGILYCMENEQLFASKYKLYLRKEELREEIEAQKAHFLFTTERNGKAKQRKILSFLQGSRILLRKTRRIKMLPQAFFKQNGINGNEYPAFLEKL